MKIVFLDMKTLGEEIDYGPFEQLGEVVFYPFSAQEEIPERVKDAEVIVVNKARMDAKSIGEARNLRMVCVTGTGTNNLDKEYLQSQGIAWRNVAGYSTESVAQHTFAMLFYLMEHLRFYDDYVRQESYIDDKEFTHFSSSFHELKGKTWGIFGLGAIGRRVADLASAFGAKVIYYSASGRAPQNGYRQVDFDTLLRSSDILSIHAPLNEFTEGRMNVSAFQKMKGSAILLNLGRGAIVCEQDLADALNAGLISAAGLDVLIQEPMSGKSPLLGVKDKNRLLITPHVAWAAVETRQRLMGIVAEQIREFFENGR